MTERHVVPGAYEHTGGDSRVELDARSVGHRRDQPRLGTARYDGHRLDDGAVGRVEPAGAGEDRQPHRGRDLLARRRQGLGDEEGVAAGAFVELVGVGAVRRREHADRRERQGGQPDPDRRPRRDEVADHPAQGVVAVDLAVAIGDDESERQVAGAAAEHAEQLQRGVIGPVGVLDDDDGRTPAAEGVDERAEQAVAVGRRVETERNGDVEERPERSWRRQRVASPDGPRCDAGHVEELGDDGGLADAGVPGDESDPAVPARRVIERAGEHAPGRRPAPAASPSGSHTPCRCP